MGLNTYPSNPFPPSTDRMDADVLEAEVNELKSGLTNVQSDVKLNTNDLTTPSRTKNILPITLASIKALNTDGTWSGSSYTVNGVTFAVSTDSNGNISKINATGTATDVTYLILVNPFDTVSLAGCLINGLPSEGSSNSFNYRIASSSSWSALQDINSNNTAITNNGATCRIAIRIQSTYEIATGGIDFYPMVRIATETNATYAPYIPSVESRIEAVENGLTNCVKTVKLNVGSSGATQSIPLDNNKIYDIEVSVANNASVYNYYHWFAMYGQSSWITAEISKVEKSTTNVALTYTIDSSNNLVVTNSGNWGATGVIKIATVDK